MSGTRAFRVAPSTFPAVGAQAFFDAFGISKAVLNYGRAESIFRQGDTGDDVFYIQSGGVKLSVTSKTHGDAVVGTLGPGDFFGEGCLANQPLRLTTATAITPSEIRLVGKRKMIQLLHTHPAMCDQFISNMLSRTMRIQEDLAKQAFKTNERRGIL